MTRFEWYWKSIFGQFVSVVTCDKCGGEGQVVSEVCTQCRGDGRVRETRRLAVKVPAGIDEGAQIRLAGEGEAGQRGAPPGDLYIEIAIRPHKLFKRADNDIVLELNLNVAQAALGAEIKVPTVDGTETDLKIPAGTQNGRTFKLTGQGMPRLKQPDKRGDLYAILDVQLPTELGDEEKQLYTELQRIYNERGGGK